MIGVLMEHRERRKEREQKGGKEAKKKKKPNFFNLLQWFDLTSAQIIHRGKSAENAIYSY